MAVDHCDARDACDSVKDLQRRIESHEGIVAQKLDAISEQLRDLRPLLTEAVRLSGQHDRLTDALTRIGKQVDGHDIRLDKQDERLGTLERFGAGTGEQVSGNRQLIMLIVSIVSPLLVGILVFWATRGG